MRLADFMRSAQELQPFVAAEADEAERLRHMTDAVVAAFKEADLYRILVPKALGGVELSWIEAMRVVEQIARVDGSTGWCLMVGAAAVFSWGKVCLTLSYKGVGYECS